MREEVNVELLRTRNEFRKYYDEGLRKDYTLLEDVRKVYLRRFIIILVCFLVPVWWWFFVCAEPQGGYWTDGLVRLYCFYGIVAYMVCRIPFVDYKEKTKSLVMKKILLFFDSSARLCKNVIKKYDVQESGLVVDFDDIERDDEFEIVKDGVKIVVSEQKITKTVQTNKGSRDVTVFNGVMMMLDFDKKFEGKIVAREKGKTVSGNFWLFLALVAPFISTGVFSAIGQENYWVYRFILILIVCTPFLLMGVFVGILKLFEHMWTATSQGRTAKLQQVLLEDVVFAKKWKVMGTDQVEARYVLTPALMERLLKVKKCFYGNKLDFAFYNNKLLIAVSTNKDMFETTFLLNKAASYHKVNEVVSQLFSVCSVASLVMKQKRN